MLPFLGRDDLKELATECLKGTVDLSIEEVLPFLNASDVDALFNQFRKENGEIDLTFDLFLSQSDKELNVDALPFVSEEGLHKLVLKYVENPDLEMDVDKLYPYLSAQDIPLLFKTYLSKHKKK